MEFKPDRKLVVARRFKALRRKALLTQLRLADLIEICRQSISEIENARVTLRQSTWDAFCDLEAKHDQHQMPLPVHWS